jgi:hypothetical protein
MKKKGTRCVNLISLWPVKPPVSKVKSGFILIFPLGVVLSFTEMKKTTYELPGIRRSPNDCRLRQTLLRKVEAKIGVPNWCAISHNSGLDHRSKGRAFGCVTPSNTSVMINVRPLRANCGRTGYSNAGHGAEIGRIRADLSREGCRPQHPVIGLMHILQRGDRR